MRDGQVVEVAFDQRWLPDASPASIAEQARAALSAAAAAWREQSATPALNGRSFQELREVTADPAALLRRLGLAR
jgi:hypothetical protein